VRACEIERIAVIGCIGAGKSTLARVLGDRLDLPVIHLDRLWWQDGSYKITGPKTAVAHALSPDAFEALQADLVQRERWVMDGGVQFMSLRLERADTVVFLDLPAWVCVWRVLRRTGRARPDYPPDVRESLRWTLVLLHWVIWKYPRQRRSRINQGLRQHAQHAEVFHLRTRNQVAAFQREHVPPPERS
jgi:adenylate kinase family enzyme